VKEMSKQTVTSIRVDEELWKEAKIYAIRNGITLADLLEKLLKEELRKGRKGAQSVARN
jgi:predicted DNA-binding ribbon-helix-helix protein